MVQFDTLRQWAFVAHVDGYVQQLFVSSPGQAVDKDQPLVSIYSPNLLTTEHEFITLLQMRDGARGKESAGTPENLITAARLRLKQWNISDAQIADLEKIYWARSRVIEYLNSVRGSLPEGVNPVIGPDATGVGWVYEHALVDDTGKHSLADLRSLQDWNLRYALESVKGVSEVASIGGFVKEYQVDLDPNALAAYKIPLGPGNSNI